MYICLYVRTQMQMWLTISGHTVNGICMHCVCKYVYQFVCVRLCAFVCVCVWGARACL